ncbi:MAG: FKBP-type peptidyl-prolyl cis-trans isomerase [Candidatus Egerieousia sp.]
MKVIKTIALCAVSALLLASCGGNKAPKLAGISQSEIDSASVAIGVYFGDMLKASSLENLNLSKVMSAMKKELAGDTTLPIKSVDAGMVIQKYVMKCQDAMLVLKTEEEKKFFAENKKNKGVQETESGLQYQIIEAGSDVKATAQDTVEVNYKGALLNGKVFDSSYERGESTTFPLNAVIPGWSEGLQLVGEGGKIKLWIPFNLAYGNRAMGPNLPACSTLVFDVELISVKKAEVPAEEAK